MQNSKVKKSTSYILKFISEHKLISTSIVIFIMCCTLNFILIYNFMKILTYNF